MDDRYIGKIELTYYNGKYIAVALGAYGMMTKSSSKNGASVAIANLVKKTGWIR